MEPSSNIPDIGTYLDEISVIRPDDVHHLVHKERIRDHVLSFVCSLVLHALMLFLFSISMFHSPALVVSSDPASIWLIPFISAGDIFSEAELQRDAGKDDPDEADSEEPVRDVDLPKVAGPRRAEERVTDSPDVAETTDAELIVLKQRQKTEQPAKPKPRTPKAAAEVRPQVTASEPPVLKTAKIEQPDKTSGPQTPAPADNPVIAAETSQATAEMPRPMEKKITEPVPPPQEIMVAKEATTRLATATPDPIRKAPVAAQPAHVPVPAPQRKVESAAPAPARPEQRNHQPPKTGIDKSVPKEPRAAVVQTARQATPVPAVVARQAVVETVRPQPPAKPEVPRGIVAPKITGDIKLTVSGSVIPAINITFQEFAASRRNRPLSRTEARRETSVAPLVTSLEGSHNFVVVQARAGIYTITAGAKETASSATFLLKLFEGGPREATRKIGTLKVDEKVVVVKILMPDGIIWDDEAAFTGSLEDSDSITKFNSDTGLTWKEYK